MAILSEERYEKTGKKYPVRLILKVVGCSSGNWYQAKAPKVLWATDGKKFHVDELGWCWFFGVIDHFNDQLLSWHICKKGDRYAAMEPVREAVRKTYGNVDKDVCKGLELKLRSDHGTQYDSNDFKREMEYLGLDMSKSFVRSPESNGCIERFNRTLDEARAAIAKFIDDYNKGWLIGRLGYKSPLEYMTEYEQNKVALATA